MDTTADLHTTFVAGLRNAHAMENEALSIMNAQVKREPEYTDLVARLRQHITETEEQVRRLDMLLSQLGEDGSLLKDTALSISGKLSAMGHATTDDEILKNLFSDAAFESYEIAAYQALITLAGAGGYDSAVPPLKASLKEEESMADWLNRNVPQITLRYVGEAGLSPATGLILEGPRSERA